MKSKIRINFNLLILTVFSLITNYIYAQEKVLDWQYLFDGKTLNGWVQLNGTAKYEVIDGSIVGTSVLGSPNSFLCTDKYYGNFILELEFKADEGLNSGIQIRSQCIEEYRNGIVHGYQVEIDPAQTKLYSKNPPNFKANGEKIPPGIEPCRWTGGIYDEKRRGWLCDLSRNESARLAFKPDEWNKLRIEAIGDGFRTWINGVPAAKLVDSMTPNGFIGLQVHATKQEGPMKVRWRNIRIKDFGYNKAHPQISDDPFIGNWHSYGNIAAQVYPVGDGKYHANLLHDIEKADNPFIVLEGIRNNNTISFIGDGWNGQIENKRFKIEKGNEEFELRRFTNYSPTLNEEPPKNAIVLFDGTNLDAWLSQKPKEWETADGPATDWKIIPGGRLEVVPGAGSIITKKKFGDFKLHLEFRLLGEKTNGGVYLMSRYEINIKDSFGKFKESQYCAFGNLAEEIKPLANAAAPDFRWQTLDIDFNAPRFDENNKVIHLARTTIFHNGIMIYNDVELGKRKGAAKRLGDDTIGSLMLQEHGTAYQFRNIWIIDKNGEESINERSKGNLQQLNQPGRDIEKNRKDAGAKQKKIKGNRKPPNRDKKNSNKNKTIISAEKDQSDTTRENLGLSKEKTSNVEKILIEFPKERPKNGNFNRPAPGHILDVSPPGFCWWRAGDRDLVKYKLKIRSNNKDVYVSPSLDEPAHVPTKVLPEGSYTWIVDAITPSGEVAATRSLSEFSITKNAAPLAWADPEELLKRVPKKHPRLLFPHGQLQEIRESLKTTRKSAFNELRKAADQALTLPVMKKPDFDKYVGKKLYATKRTEYRKTFWESNRIYNHGMVPLALMYLLSDEKKYGIAAKKHLLNLIDWGIDGVTSLDDPRFDEVGLHIVRTVAQCYDWCYDLLDENERRAVEDMLLARGNQMLDRMLKRDFLNTSGESHDGRVPGYLVEFSIALAEMPEAIAWLEYGLTAILTVFPHWGGKDGGWGEGISYALSYNDRFISPFASLYVSTGYDLWQKSFFRKFRNFLVYNISPKAECMPFGDMEHIGIESRAAKLRSILYMHALRYRDPGVRWWIDLLGKETGENEMNLIQQFILADTLTPARPRNIPQDMAFFGVGWAAFHSDIANPDEDLMVLFKSSPFGTASHSHADQNSFAILKGGKALAIPAGERYPQHGSPFHTQYTRLTVAHNALLINGNGQIDDKGKSANGKLISFKTLPHIGYAAGDAGDCYGKPVNNYIRHVVLIRPSVVLVVDDLKADEPVLVEWLMHAKEKFDLDGENQSFIAHRSDASMNVHLFTPGGFNLNQNDLWPVDPKEGYPMISTESPANQWHLTAQVREQSQIFKCLAVLDVGGNRTQTQIKMRRINKYKIEITADFIGIGNAHAMFDLSEKREDSSEPMIEIHYLPKQGEKEDLVVYKN